MDIFFPLAAFLMVLAGSLRSLGLGVAAIFAVGYFNGIIRANFLGIFTTFMFDFGLLALYLVFFIGKPDKSKGVWNNALGIWVACLIGWPTIMVMVPINDYLVQMVAWRGTVWFLPIILIGYRLVPSDLTTISRGLAILNLIALAFGIYTYIYGVESLYPHNAVTLIMYQSSDVAGGKHRVPSTFLNGHAYGGTMLFTLPFLLDRVFGTKSNFIDRILAGSGVVAALGGIMLCAARYPVIALVVSFLVVWVLTRFNPIMGVIAAGLGAIALQVALNDERLQRFTSLEDTEYVSNRLNSSANAGFFDLMAEYPAGAGMGSGMGNSIPFFLQEVAPKQIGYENEFCRILIDQGMIGLALWVAFLLWLFMKPPPLKLDIIWGLGVIMMFGLTFTIWATSFIGSGTLSMIPGTAMILIQMGVIGQVREAAASDI